MSSRHGLSRSPEYTACLAARGRCTNPKHPDYPRYGGRGIEYRLPRGTAEAAALIIATLGPRPEGLTLDRIDNNGHYEIGNLRWATRSEQRRNQRPESEWATDAAGRSGASAPVSDFPAPAVVDSHQGLGAGERRGAGPLASRHSLSNK